MRLGWAIMLAISAVTLALAWPAGAGRVALALVALAVGAVVVPALSSARRRFPIAADVEPFRTARPARVPPDKPNQLVVLERSIGSSSNAGDTITFAIRDQLRVHAKRRLRDHHRLDLDDPADQHEVYRRVSPELWKVVAPLPRDVAGRARAATPVASSSLGALISEIETL